LTTDTSRVKFFWEDGSVVFE